MIAEPILAALDQLVLLVVFGLLAAVSSWLTKRREAAMAEKAGTEGPGKPREAVEGEGQPDLQEMLRRLMGEEAAPRHVPPTLPPPVTVTLPAMPPRPVRQESVVPNVGGMRVPGVGREVQSVVTRHVTVVPTAAGGGGVVRVARRGGAARAMLRTPAMARQAFVVAQVLGVPRSLEK